MATKRQAPDDRETHGTSSFKHGPKRRKPNSTTKPFQKAHPVNDLKSQIRSLKRLLEHNSDLPPGVRIEKERALQTAQHELAAANRAKRRSEMIGRYHKVRFFDRQKATRRLKKAKKELRAYEGADETERARLASRVDDAETELNYAQFYPLEKAYVPLFPTRRKPNSADNADENAKSEEPLDRQGDPEMWETIKKCQAEGTLELLREGKLLAAGDNADIPPAPVSTTKQANASKSVKATKSERGSNGKAVAQASAEEGDDAASDDDESDGGFFE